MAAVIYFDNQATTPTDPRVRDAMLPFLDVAAVGNPHSAHAAGQRAARLVEEARAKVSLLIGAQPGEVYFTSGATEANNIAIRGVAQSPRRRGNHVITCATEHKCVLETTRYLARNGFRVDVLRVSRDGLIDVDMLTEAFTDQTALVSVMLANNEIGVLQPISDIADACHRRGVVFHTDAAQAVGKMPVDVRKLGVDMLSLSAHKIYAPIGVGALFVSDASPLRPEPLFWGGTQESGLRAGTLAPHLCAALGVASDLAATEMAADSTLTRRLAERFFELVRARIPDVKINGHPDRRLRSNLSLTLPGVDADHLVGALQPLIALSTSAACSAGVLQPSHVLLALGLSEIDADNTIRVGFGRFNTLTEVETAADILCAKALAIREQRMV
jgi:cysteine desulfurase